MWLYACTHTCTHARTHVHICLWQQVNLSVVNRNLPIVLLSNTTLFCDPHSFLFFNPFFDNNTSSRAICHSSLAFLLCMQGKTNCRLSLERTSERCLQDVRTPVSVNAGRQNHLCSPSGKHMKRTPGWKCSTILTLAHHLPFDLWLCYVTFDDLPWLNWKLEKVFVLAAHGIKNTEGNYLCADFS